MWMGVEHEHAGVEMLHRDLHASLDGIVIVYFISVRRIHADINQCALAAIAPLAIQQVAKCPARREQGITVDALHPVGLVERVPF